MNSSKRNAALTILVILAVLGAILAIGGRDKMLACRAQDLISSANGVNKNAPPESGKKSGDRPSKSSGKSSGSASNSYKSDYSSSGASWESFGSTANAYSPAASTPSDWESSDPDEIVYEFDDLPENEDVVFENAANDSGNEDGKKNEAPVGKKKTPKKQKTDKKNGTEKEDRGFFHGLFHGDDDSPKKNSDKEKPEKKANSPKGFWKFGSGKNDKMTLQEAESQLDSAARDAKKGNYTKAFQKAIEVAEKIRESERERFGTDKKNAESKKYKTLVNRALEDAKLYGSLIDNCHYDEEKPLIFEF